MLDAPTKLCLLIGPVGAGKSTWGRRKAAASKALFLDVDEWMVRLFGADKRPEADVIAWYLQRRERCRELIWDVALQTLRSGLDVYLELGLVGREERLAAYQRANNDELILEVVLIDAPREVRRERVAKRNESAAPYVQVVPPAMFEMASDAWEPPDEAEQRAWDLIDA